MRSSASCSTACFSRRRPATSSTAPQLPSDRRAAQTEGGDSNPRDGVRPRHSRERIALSHEFTRPGDTHAYSEPTHRQSQNRQDAELVRVASYAGLRLGELLALRWRDVDFAGPALTIERAMSDGIESSTKSGRIRRVPLPDQAAGGPRRLGKARGHTGRK